MIDVVVVGIGGYGSHNLRALLDRAGDPQFRVVAAVDPAPHRSPHLQTLADRQIPLLPTLEAFSAQHRADLALISTPIHLHAPQACHALAHGMHVLCEKPLCSTMADALRMSAAQRQAGLHAAIGYQASFSAAVQQLKAAILAGKMGKPLRMRAIVLAPRGDAYYRRNAWAGAKHDANGTLILDSPVNNACAHHLHNMLYVIGDRVDRAAKPLRVTAELYRANPIENYDTAAIRCETESGTDILFITSHATDGEPLSAFSYEFERATVQMHGSAIVARFTDGTTETYGDPSDDSNRKIWLTLDAIDRGAESICGIEAAMSQTQCMWAAQHSQPQITHFPDAVLNRIDHDGAPRTTVISLHEVLRQCYERNHLPSDLQVPWATPGRTVAVDALDPQNLPANT